jgi:putative ABC transport system ATP-binding protein
MVAVMGPSGSGKTTLLSLAGGLDRPTSGEVLVEGIALAGMTVSELATLRRRRVGYVFQQFNLIDGLTAVENVSIPLELDGVSRRKATSVAMQALDDLGLTELAGRFPDELSGGEQQRVAIARAVVGDRVLLLADEPTGALDTVTGESVLRLMRRHCEDGGAGVLVTHDARLAAWADRVVFLRDGRIIDETGPPKGPEELLDPVNA